MLLRRLQRAGVLHMGQAVSEGGSRGAVEVRIGDDALRSDDVKRLCDLLGL